MTARCETWGYNAAMRNVGDRVRTEGGTTAGVVVKLFSNGGSALVEPDREGLPLILLSRDKVTRIDDPNAERPA